MQNYELKWTQKVELNRVIDPLGLRSLKILEDRFLQGITTQTERLRYFTLLTWAYRKIEDADIYMSQILKVEKIFTLIAQNHHMTDRNPPRGIRNSRSAASFLRSRKSFNVQRFTKFGVGGRNKEGYAHYYYRNPLRVLGILQETLDGETRVSKTGKRIADVFEGIAGKPPFQLTQFSTRRLSRYQHFCLCRKKIPKSEQRLWRRVFFWFTRIDENGDMDLDEKSFEMFHKGKMLDSAEYKDWHKLGSANFSFEDFFDTYSDRGVKRGYSLLLTMKIVDEANPETSLLNQTIRDAIYFRQVLSRKRGLRDIDFGKLEHLRSLWEVHVHNLYYISVLEGIFYILLKFLETRPFGASIDEVASRIDTKKIRNSLNDLGFPKDCSKIEDIMERVKSKLEYRSNLKMELNEREIFLRSQQTEKKEEVLAHFLTLLALLQHRHGSFNDQQAELLQYTEQDLPKLSPSSFYQISLKGAFSSFFKNMLEMLKNRHRLVSSRKYIDGTKSWLITEEGKLLFHYGKHYYWTPYREAKWRNVVELLYDMGLIDKEGDILKVSKLGKTWLRRIM